MTKIVKSRRISLQVNAIGDGPAVLPRQLSQQPEQEPPRTTAGLDPGEPAGHPIEQSVGLSRPPGWSYSAAHGHSLII
jgi:hypothetical protein